MFVILLSVIVGFIIRIFLAVSFYGGGDATNGASFYDLIKSGYDVYSIDAPWPYLPFSNAFAWMWGKISELFKIEVNLSYRLTSIFYDIGIGIVMYLYIKKYNSIRAIYAIWLYMINPLTIFLVSLTGFTDSAAIFFILLAAYLVDFYDGKMSSFLSAISFAVSVSLKPFSLIFFPLFIYKNRWKCNFLFTTVITIILLNSYYILGASVNDEVCLSRWILNKMVVGHQAGNLGISALTSYYPELVVAFSRAVNFLGILLTVLIYVLLIHKLKSAEFVFVVFLLTFLFNNHIHPQYLLWLVPFVIICVLEKSYLYIIGCSLILLGYAIQWQSPSVYCPNVMLGGFSQLKDVCTINLVGIFGHPAVRFILYLAVVLALIPSKYLRMLFESIREIGFSPYRVKLQIVFSIILLSIIFGGVFYIMGFEHARTTYGLILRTGFFVVIPSFVCFYFLYCYVKYKFCYVIFCSSILFIVSYLIRLGMPDNFGVIYSLCITGASFLILYNKILKQYYSQTKRNTHQMHKILSKEYYVFIFFLIPILFMFIFSWKDLYSSAKNKFYGYLSSNYTYENEKRGRFINKMSIPPPQNGFNYGTSYIFETSFCLPESIKNVHIFLVSEDHHKLIVNNTELPVEYGALYIARHGTKRKIYDNGIREINITQLVRSGYNKLAILNNLSSLTQSVGIGLKIVANLINGDVITFKSQDLQWEVAGGRCCKDTTIGNKKKLEFRMKTKDTINWEYYGIHPGLANQMLGDVDYSFIVPIENSKNNRSIIWFILIFFSALCFIYFYIYKKSLKESGLIKFS